MGEFLSLVEVKGLSTVVTGSQPDRKSALRRAIGDRRHEAGAVLDNAPVRRRGPEVGPLVGVGPNAAHVVDQTEMVVTARDVVARHGWPLLSCDRVTGSRSRSESK